MTFKTQPHRYSIDLAPTSRARCRGCRQLIEKGSLRLAVHAFVRPNRATVFARHLTAPKPVVRAVHRRGAPAAQDVTQREVLVEARAVRVMQRVDVRAFRVVPRTIAQHVHVEACRAALVVARGGFRRFGLRGWPRSRVVSARVASRPPVGGLAAAAILGIG